MMSVEKRNGELFVEFLDVMNKLLGPGGCPWDREQTHQTLKRYLIEEAYEVYEVIDNGELDRLPDELGDVLLQVVFHSMVASREGRFGIDDVLENVKDKMIRRHPHVFADTEVSCAGEVEHRWEQLKKEESGKKETESIMNIPKNLAPLYRAEKIQQKAADVGFEWEEMSGSIEKIEEECEELRNAMDRGSQSSVEEELGDILFSVVNVCRYSGVDPVDALQASNDKFVDRFRKMEKEVAGEGKQLEKMSLEDKEKYWVKAKKR